MMLNTTLNKNPEPNTKTNNILTYLIWIMRAKSKELAIFFDCQYQTEAINIGLQWIMHRKPLSIWGMISNYRCIFFNQMNCGPCGWLKNVSSPIWHYFFSPLYNLKLWRRTDNEESFLLPRHHTMSDWHDISYHWRHHYGGGGGVIMGHKCPKTTSDGGHRNVF